MFMVGYVKNQTWLSKESKTCSILSVFVKLALAKSLNRKLIRGDVRLVL